MDLIDRLISIIEPTIDSMGYELVRVQLQGNRRQTLQVMADRKDGAGMTVEDCTAISHGVSAVLDVEDPISGAYNLEISSPGIDRPLTRNKDFVTWAGFDCRVETKSMFEGRKRLSGRLLGVEDERVLLHVEDKEYRIPFEAIHRAKLLLTDELIKAVSGDATDAASDNDNDIQDES
jgi:ribosome maturation factor RimP